MTWALTTIAVLLVAYAAFSRQLQLHSVFERDVLHDGEAARRADRAERALQPRRVRVDRSLASHLGASVSTPCRPAPARDKPQSSRSKPTSRLLCPADASV